MSGACRDRDGTHGGDRAGPTASERWMKPDPAIPFYGPDAFKVLHDAVRVQKGHADVAWINRHARDTDLRREAVQNKAFLPRQADHAIGGFDVPRGRVATALYAGILFIRPAERRVGKGGVC